MRTREVEVLGWKVRNDKCCEPDSNEVCQKAGFGLLVMVEKMNIVD